MLLDQGAKINSTNKKGATPLIIAAVKGHYSVLRVLANHRQVKLHEQVSTASIHHCILLPRKNCGIGLLFELLSSSRNDYCLSV